MIDIYSHILTPGYMEALKNYGVDVKRRVSVTTLWDMEERFRIMDRFDGLRQVIVPGGTPAINATPAQEAELARIANDEVTELVSRHPDRFAGAAALLPLQSMEETLRETDRAIGSLHLQGVHLPTPALGRPIDRPEFMPLYEKMCSYDLPIWLHPTRPALPEYPGEEGSVYDTFCVWGWPYESTIAMTRLVLSNVMTKFPALKMIIHHAGAMVPFFADRIVNTYGVAPGMGRQNHTLNVKGDVLDYFRRFYVDTALNGSTAGLMCAYAFYGADHLLFGTDAPYDARNGLIATRDTIASIKAMTIPEAEKKQIFETNARKLMNL